MYFTLFNTVSALSIVIFDILSFQMLLDLTRGICEEQTNMDKLVQRIMLTAGSQLSCQRQNVYLLDSPETQDVSWI